MSSQDKVPAPQERGQAGETRPRAPRPCSRGFLTSAGLSLWVRWSRLGTVLGMRTTAAPLGPNPPGTTHITASP